MLKTTKLFLLNNNKITSIAKNLLDAFHDMEYLNLSFNKIGSIEEYSFLNFNSLKVLNLNNNLLEYLNSNHLAGLDNLEKLYLNDNLFKAFNDYTFMNLKNRFTHLDISFNQLNTVREFLFNGLIRAVYYIFSSQ